jgi:DNA replication protein DnaC
VSEPIAAELRQLLRRLKLSPMLDTLPERLALARESHLPHQDFLTVILADEVERRDRTGAALRARTARLDATMTIDDWDDTTEAVFDRQLWAELLTLRFIEAGHDLIIAGPIGVGKTFMANAVGHVASRRHYRVHFARTDQLLKRLRAARLDNSHDAELRRLIAIDVLVLDDFCLKPLDAAETSDVFELIVERHRRSSTIVTTNREPPGEWLAAMADPLLAESAVDRLTSNAYHLVVEGPSYRQRQRPKPPPPTSPPPSGGPKPLSAPPSRAHAGVKAKPSGRPPAGLDPGSMNQTQQTPLTQH